MCLLGRPVFYTVHSMPGSIFHRRMQKKTHHSSTVRARYGVVLCECELTLQGVYKSGTGPIRNSACWFRHQLCQAIGKPRADLKFKHVFHEVTRKKILRYTMLPNVVWVLRRHFETLRFMYSFIQYNIRIRSKLNFDTTNNCLCSFPYN